MKLVEKMDAGPILLQEGMPLAPDETSSSLETKLTPVGADLLMETIRRLKDGTLRETPQREEGATYAPMLKKEDGLIDWAMPARVIERRIRAFSPWPSAYTRWQGQLLKVHRADVVDGEIQAPPGQVVRADKHGLWVGTGDGLLDLQELQMENRKRLPSAELVRGMKIEKGARF